MRNKLSNVLKLDTVDLLCILRIVYSLTSKYQSIYRKEIVPILDIITGEGGSEELNIFLRNKISDIEKKKLTQIEQAFLEMKWNTSKVYLDRSTLKSHIQSDFNSSDYLQ